jgi:hypothetical protein
MTNVPASTRVWAKLPRHIHTYFFRYVLAGEHSAKQDITAYFYDALYNECQKRGIAPQWTPENLEAVRNILKNLNFNHERPTNPASPKHQTQPHDSEYDRRGANYPSK